MGFVPQRQPTHHYAASGRGIYPGEIKTIILMHNPPHPGEIIRELCLEPLELTVTDAAKALGVKPQYFVQGIKRACQRQS